MALPRQNLQICGEIQRRRREKSRIVLILGMYGGRGRNRINNLMYFQQHAGQRMILKTTRSSLKPINRAQIERGFASSVQ
jgi:hypothetical protein